MSHCTGVSLRDMLALPTLKHVRLVAGAGGLDRMVCSVNVMEVPDIVDWTRAGELLLTTVFAIRDDVGAQSRLISELAARDLAGLAIKPGRYIEKIPTSMIEQADLYDFPLLEIPYIISFSDIINPILTEISHQQLAVIQQADAVHLNLNRVIVEGGDMQDIAGVLVRSLNNNVAIIQTISQQAIVAPKAYSDNPDIRNFITANSRYEADTGRGKVRLDDKETGYFRAAISVGKKWYGTIAVLETSVPLSRCDEVTIERAAVVAALVLVNQLAVTAVERRYYNEFLNEMLIASPVEEKNLTGRARDLGIDLQSPHIAAVIGFDCKSDGWDEEYQLIAQRITQGLKEKFPEIAVGFKLDTIILFIPLPKVLSDRDLDKVRGKIKTIQQQLVVKLCRFSKKSPGYFGVGRPGSGLAGVQSSYQEAVKACEIGRKIWPGEHICYYNALGAWRLLGNMHDKRELVSFIEETLGKVLMYDREKGAELLKTLEIYFECNGKLKKVTEKMYVHYNTILYRLNRIEQITGCSLDDATACLNLQLALKLLKIMKD